MKPLSIFTLCCALLTSCQYRPTKQIDKSLTKTTDSFLAELKKQENARANSLNEHYNWDEALVAMYTKNKNCRNASFNVDDSKTRQKAIWRNFIPGVNTSLSNSGTVDDLTSAFIDPTFRINSFLSLGNLLNLPKNIYTRKLSTIAAELTEQQTMRSQTVALYKIFEERRLWELEGEGLNLSRQLTEVVAAVDPLQAEREREGLDKKIESWEEREKTWLEKIGEFYTAHGGQVTIDQDSAPRIRYTNKDLDFYDTQRWGKLQLKLLAMQELSEDGSIKAAYLRYLPTFSLGATAPTLFSNSSNTDFDVNDISLSPRASWRLDTTGAIGHQVKRLKRDKPFKDWERERRVKSEVKKLLNGRETLLEKEREVIQLRQAKKEYLSLVREGLIQQSPEQMVDKLQGLYRKEIELEATIIQISTGFWLIDEAWWSKHKTPWKNVKS